MEWISVKDKLPETGHIYCVVAYSFNGMPWGYDVSRYWQPVNMKRKIWELEFANTLPIKVTHWIPLPNPPEES